MLSLRIRCKASDVEDVIKKLMKNFNIISVSRFYLDRGDSGYGRVYIEID